MNNSVSITKPKKEKDVFGDIATFLIFVIVVVCIYLLFNPVPQNTSSLPAEKVVTEVNK
jgi:hypothetical protein